MLYPMVQSASCYNAQKQRYIGSLCCISKESYCMTLKKSSVRTFMCQSASASFDISLGWAQLHPAIMKLRVVEIRLKRIWDLIPFLSFLLKRWKSLKSILKKWRKKTLWGKISCVSSFLPWANGNFAHAENVWYDISRENRYLLSVWTATWCFLAIIARF